MKKINRRNFMKSSIVSAAGVGIAAGFPKTTWSKVRGANEDIRMAVCGFNGQGSSHINRFRQIEGVRVVAICDPDRNLLDRKAAEFTQRNEKVETYTDVRKLLENKDIDAISIAAPNHWHSLMSIWACQAGKDVYVEKPVSHNIFEGRKVVEAARKYNRIVQAGTQYRSDKGMYETIDYINEGHVGKIVAARGLCYKRRASLGKVKGPQPIPKAIDYDLWAGPAPLEPLMREKLHYDWHWVWQTGNGDIGNQGIHEMDMCRWSLGQAELAPRVMSIGGRFGYDDDGATANTQIGILDYKPAPLIFEVQGLPRTKETTSMDNYKGIGIGIVIECEGGYYAGGRGGYVYDNDGNRMERFLQEGPGQHQDNFIDAVRSRNIGDLTADILKGQISSALCHMANISHRLGHYVSPAEVRKAIEDRPLILEAFDRFEKHLAANDVDINKTGVILGPWLEMDPKSEKFVGSDDYGLHCFANELATRNYREPFVVPEKV